MIWGNTIVDLQESLESMDATLSSHFNRYLVKPAMPESIDLLVDENVKKLA